MAFLSLTKKASKAFNIDIKNAATHPPHLLDMEDWVVDTIWPEKKKNPGILFYNRATGFALALNPAEYALDYCLCLVQKQLSRFLIEHGMEEKVTYFNDLFRVIHLCKNNDSSAVGYMTQSKSLIGYPQLAQLVT